MTVSQDLQNELTQLVGLAVQQPKVVSLQAPDQVEVSIELLAVDSLSCAVWQIALTVPKLVGCNLKSLETWSQDLCQRVTYLLEDIGPIEVDSQQPQVLIRSTPPAQSSSNSKYYEVRLQSQSSGVFTLRRFQSERGLPGRQQVKLHLTHEVLIKLVDDLLVTIPVP